MRPLPNPEPNTAASVMYEWYCITEQGRVMIRSASDMKTCIERAYENGHRLKFIKELSEYEAEIAAKEAQEAYNAELIHHIEEVA